MEEEKRLKESLERQKREEEEQIRLLELEKRKLEEEERWKVFIYSLDPTSFRKSKGNVNWKKSVESLKILNVKNEKRKKEIESWN